jgi:hypothetical protein
VSVDEAVAILPELHATVVARGTPSKAAAKYLAAWFGGLVARTVGYAAIGSGAGFLADAGELRWRVHPGGWADGLDLGHAVALVGPDHPWSGRPGTETVREPTARAALAVADAVRPLVEALRPLSGLGLPGLWAEVGDGFGEPLAHQWELAVTEERLTVLRGLAAAPGTPWRTRPALWAAPGEHGTVCVVRKGGCCRAFTEPEPEAPDDELRALVERFPEEAGAPRYCSSCALRDAGSCEAQQIWWHDRHRRGAGFTAG